MRDACEPSGSMVEDVFLLAGTVVDGRFAIERVVARGGFGLVYKGTHIALGSPIAFKVLSVPEPLRGVAEEALVERFRGEARTLATLRHPAIVRVLDVGRSDAVDRPFVWMAMEWLNGHTLAADIVARRGRGRSPREVITLLAPALDAIASTHARSLAHRDLKPANLMLAPTPDGEVLHVLDFGIAKEMVPDEDPGSGRTTTEGTITAFSLDHAAPEQIGRARTGPWTDVHALGLLVTELLTGRSPYPGDDTFAVCAAVMSPERPTPARQGLNVGPWESVLQRATALHPADRHPTAAELRADLMASTDEAQRAWQRSHGEHTAPEHLGARSKGLRKPGTGLAVVVVAMLASAALAVTLWHARSPSAQAPPPARSITGPPTSQPSTPIPIPPVLNGPTSPQLTAAPQGIDLPALSPTPSRQASSRAPVVHRPTPRAAHAAAVPQATAPTPEIVIE